MVFNIYKPSPAVDRSYLAFYVNDVNVDATLAFKSANVYVQRDKPVFINFKSMDESKNVVSVTSIPGS